MAKSYTVLKRARISTKKFGEILRCFSLEEDYNSKNTERMNVGEIEEMLLSQPEIISELKNRGN